MGNLTKANLCKFRPLRPLSVLLLLLMSFCFQTASAQVIDQNVAAHETSFKSQIFSMEDLQGLLAKNSIVRGDFAQSRTMSMFKQPLLSKGHFVLSKDNGLLWRQTQPFSVFLTLTQNKLKQQFANQTPQLMSAKDNPMVFYFSHLFLSLFQGNTQALTLQFDLLLTGNKNHWQLNLTPKEAPLNQVFSSIQLAGSDYINSLLLTENRGDKTSIIFTNQRSLPTSLTVEEQREFNI